MAVALSPAEWGRLGGRSANDSNEQIRTRKTAADWPGEGEVPLELGEVLGRKRRVEDRAGVGERARRLRPDGRWGRRRIASEGRELGRGWRGYDVSTSCVASSSRAG